MSNGCYILRQNIIHISLTEIATNNWMYIFSRSNKHILLFKEACKKLDGKKLECLVLVDGLRNNSIEEIQEIYEIAREYANLVYVITPIVALLQNAISSLITESNLSESNNTVIVFIASSFGVITCILERRDKLFYPIDIFNGFDLTPYFQQWNSAPKYCLIDESIKGGIFNDLFAAFPDIVKKSFSHPLEALAYGGLCKSLCIVEPGKHFEIANFTPGISIGKLKVLLPGKTFPNTAHYSSPILKKHTVQMASTIQIVKNRLNNVTFQLKEKVLYSCEKPNILNYIFKYDEFGFLTMEKSILSPIPHLRCGLLFFDKFAILHINFQELALYDFPQNLHQIFKTTFLYEHFKDEKKFPEMAKFFQNLSTTYKALTIVYDDDNVESKIITRPNIFIIPSYIALLEYCIRNFQPIKDKLIIFVTTKTENKMYALSKRKDKAYAVVYITKIAKNLTYNGSIFYGKIKNDVEILQIIEDGTSLTNMLFFGSYIVSHMKTMKIMDYKTTLFHGALMYSTLSSLTIQNQNAPSTLSHIILEEDPIIFDKIIAQIPTKHYKIEAVFSQILSTIDKKLFWGDLIAILIPKNDAIYAFFFAQNNQKYFLHDFDTVAIETVLTPTILKHSKLIFVTSLKEIKFSSLLSPLPVKSVTVPENVTEEFLKLLKQNQTNIYYTKNYAEAIGICVKNGIFDEIIYRKKHIMTVEYDGEAFCRILLTTDTYLTLSNEEWIPLYISFAQESTRIGFKAINDLDKFPDSVLYDFMKILRIPAPNKNEIKFDPKWKFELVEMDDTKNPKIGFKVQTTKGFHLISPEMALAIFLRKFIAIFEGYTNQDITEFKILMPKSKVNKEQRNGVQLAITILEKRFDYCTFSLEMRKAF